MTRRRNWANHVARTSVPGAVNSKLDMKICTDMQQPLEKGEALRAYYDFELTPKSHCAIVKV
jgi:hypothetical protein